MEDTQKKLRASHQVNTGTPIHRPDREGSGIRDVARHRHPNQKGIGGRTNGRMAMVAQNLHYFNNYDRCVAHQRWKTRRG